MDRQGLKTFRPGDVVTVRRTVKSARYPGMYLSPGDTVTVTRMDQHVWARAADGQGWKLYDGNVQLVRRTA